MLNIQCTIFEKKKKYKKSLQNGNLTMLGRFKKVYWEVLSSI